MNSPTAEHKNYRTKYSFALVCSEIIGLESRLQPSDILKFSAKASTPFRYEFMQSCTKSCKCFAQKGL
jgi:hypothetical protein